MFIPLPEVKVEYLSCTLNECSFVSYHIFYCDLMNGNHIVHHLNNTQRGHEYKSYRPLWATYTVYRVLWH